MANLVLISEIVIDEVALEGLDGLTIESKYAGYMISKHEIKIVIFLQLFGCVWPNV